MKKFTILTVFLVLSTIVYTQYSDDEAFKAIEHVNSDPFILDENTSTTTLTFGQRFPKVAFDGTVYLVAWRDFRSQSAQNADVYASRVDEDGNPLDEGGIPICTAQLSQYPVDVIYNGTDFIVVWVDEREQGQTEVYFARVTSSGEVLDPDGIQATSGIDMVSWNNPCAGTGNEITLIAWCENMVTGGRAVKCMRIDNSGNILDPDGFVVSDTLNDYTGEMAIEYDGTNFLVVWESGIFSFYEDIRGARISSTGDVLDPDGFTIASNPDDQWVPSLAFGDGKYLVTWSDDQGVDTDIYGTFVSTEGTVADTSGFIISSAVNSQESPCITFDGTNFIVAWTDRRFDWDVYATAITPDGIVLEPDGWGVGAWQNTKTMYCDIATGTDHILVVWENKKFPLEEDVQGGRITIDEYLMPDWSGFDIGIGPYAHANPDAAFDGSNYFVVWEDFRNGIAQVYGTRVSPGGVILDPDGIYIGSNDTMRARIPKVTYNGTDYVVVWNFQTPGGYSGGGVMARVSTSGTLIDDPPIIIISDNNFSSNFTVCSDGNNALIAWNAWNVTSYDIYGAIAQQDGTVDLPFMICDADNYQEYPNLAFNGTNYFAVWEDSRQSSKDIFGTLISPNGVVLNPDGIEISNEQLWDGRPSAASNGNSFLVSWHVGSVTSESVNGALVGPDGQIIQNSIEIYVAATWEHAQNTAVAYNGNNYIVTWQNCFNEDQNYNIKGAVVDTLGSIGQIVTIDESDYNQFAPQLASGNAGQVLAAYTGYTEEINGQSVLTFRSYGNFIDQLIGIDETQIADTDFLIYPNPAGKELSVSGKNVERIKEISIYNQNGRKVLFKNQVTFPIDISVLQKGVHVVELHIYKSKIRKKIIIQ